MIDTLQNHICAAASDVDEALAFWRLKLLRTARLTVRCIPDSRSAHEFLRAARAGQIPLSHGLAPNYFDRVCVVIFGDRQREQRNQIR